MKRERVETIGLDTNVLLRFLLEEDSVLAKKARKIFEEAEKGKLKIYLDEVILAEAVWVLLSVYKLEKQVICQTMTRVLACRWVVNIRKGLMLEAVGLWSKTKLHYPDCWLFVLSNSLGLEVKTFDLGLLRMISGK